MKSNTLATIDFSILRILYKAIFLSMRNTGKVERHLYPPLYLVLTILDKSTWTACMQFFIIIIFIFFCT